MTRPCAPSWKAQQLEIVKYAHYRQFDHYFFFSGDDQDAARLRYREDEFINEDGEVTQVRARLTLIGEEERDEFDHAIMLSRSRFLASADNSLRFYQEYFAPSAELAVNKDRHRWRIVYEGTDFAINLDQRDQTGSARLLSGNQIAHLVAQGRRA